MSKKTEKSAVEKQEIVWAGVGADYVNKHGDTHAVLTREEFKIIVGTSRENSLVTLELVMGNSTRGICFTHRDAKWIARSLFAATRHSYMRRSD